MPIAIKRVFDRNFAVPGRPIFYSPRDLVYRCGPFEMDECFLARQRRDFDWHLHIARSFHECLCGTMERFMKKV